MVQSGVRIGLVGCGYWGRNLARALGSLGVLAAVVDDDPARAQESASHGARVVSLDHLLADRDIQAVAIATPAATHHDLARRCLEAAKDVFVEKPMSLRPSHGAALVELAEQQGRILMVGHLLHYHPAFEKLVEIAGSGELGRLRYAYSNRLNFGKIRREEDILWSFAPHDLSMILRLAGEVPHEVSSVGTFTLHERIADVTTTHLAFPSGLRGHVFVSWLHPSKEQRLVVIGERAMAVFDDRAPWGEKLALYRGSVEWADGIPVARPSEPEYVEVAQREPLTVEMQHFVDCVASRSRPLTDGAEGLRVLQVLDRATTDLLRGRVQAAPSHPAPPTARPGIHETAVIDDDTVIGEGTRIWHFSHVLTGSSIGTGCSLGQNVVVGPNVRIGAGCKIQNNVSVYDGVELEEDVFCGPSMVFTNVTTPRAFVDRKNEFAKTVVKRGASIGANATIVCGTTIGEYSLIGAGAVVTTDVPAYALMLGVPARRAGWVSRVGEVLGDDLRCPRTGERYELHDDRLRPVEEL